MFFVYIYATFISNGSSANIEIEREQALTLMTFFENLATVRAGRALTIAFGRRTRADVALAGA